MTFHSIRNFFLVSLLVVQTTNAQTPVRANSSPTIQEQGAQDPKTDRPSANGEGSTAEQTSIPDPLLNLLVSKGLLTTEEARAIVSDGNPENQRDRLDTL